MNFYDIFIIIGIFLGLLINFLANRKMLKKAKELTEKSYATITDVKSQEYTYFCGEYENAIKYTISYEFIVDGVTFSGCGKCEHIITPKVGKKIGIYYNKNDPKINMLACIRNGFRNASLIYVGIILFIKILHFLIFCKTQTKL